MKVRMPVQGMTCAGCEEHVVQALEHAGAENVTVDFRRGEAMFQMTDRVAMEAHSDR